MMKFTPTVVFEFDGTICDDSPSWRGWNVIDGKLIPGIGDVIQHFRECGYKVVVQSIRCQCTAGKDAVANFLELHRIEVDEIAGESVSAIATIDKNGIRFVCEPERLTNVVSGIEPWWKNAFTTAPKTPRLRRCTVQLDYKDENSVVEGYFHRWGVDYEEFETGPGPFSVGIVELDDGSVVQRAPSAIKFLDGRR